MAKRRSDLQRAYLRFLEQIAAAGEYDKVGAAFLEFTERAGFRYAALGAHLDLAGGGGRILAINYPEPWLQRMRELDFQAVDPVALWSRRSAQPIRWGDPGFAAGWTAAQARYMAEAAASGFADGYAVGLRTRDGLVGTGAVAPGREAIDPAAFTAAHAAIVVANEKALRLGAAAAPLALTAAERECLQLAAAGKSDWVIGEILGLSERTVHHTIERVKQRYGVATRVQAVARALSQGAIEAG